MKTVFNIEGMTCNGCRTDVEDQLNSIEGIRAEVSLEGKSASIYSKKEIELQKFEEVLPDKYSISKFTTSTDPKLTKVKTQDSKLKQLKPLFLILFYIAVASVLLNYNRGNWSGFMPDFMGLFFIVFSFFKFLDLKGFTISFSMYDPLARQVNLYALIYPFIETTLGILFLRRLELKIALILTLIILSITTIGVTKVLLNKSKIQCACLGTALKLPMTEATFIENAIMIIMAVLMLFN